MEISVLILYMQPSNSTLWLTMVCLGLFFILLAGGLFYQWNDRKRTIGELAHLASMHKHGVEHELVLKAMKLATWRLDISNMTVTLDSDFRARSDMFSPPPSCPVDTILESMNPVDAERAKKSMLSLYKGETDEFHEQYKVKLPHNDSEYWEESYATVAERDENGKPKVIVGTSSCIDDAKKLEHELIDARNKAEESDRLKTAFIDNISHEVRTPLNAIVGFSDILSSVTDPAERDGLVAIIKENNQKLLHIFEDMMTISKAEAKHDKANMVISGFDLRGLLNNVVNEFEGKNTNPKVAIHLDQKCQPRMLKTDMGRLREVIVHFLSNAFKFTDKGSIMVSFRDTDNAHVRISVSDTGKGIPEKDYERIFDRFIKLDEFVQGAGLGLSVCRSYAYSLGGKVGVNSVVGRGSVFWIEIPVVLKM